MWKAGQWEDGEPPEGTPATLPLQGVGLCTAADGRLRPAALPSSGALVCGASQIACHMDHRLVLCCDSQTRWDAIAGQPAEQASTFSTALMSCLVTGCADLRM